ncbi:hypothetical protein LCGC14_0383600 [marine sediment metagenome]|uniref:Uncharacterized protein n=1 Tax=marine sediment metagenome TaxID=412755 RepID=A0A0F9VNY9_9ZZZZ
MDLTELRALIIIDLKMVLDTDISKAEINRCIDRAVDDLSRHLPRERIYELTYRNKVTDNTFTTSAAQSDTSMVNAISIENEVDGGTITIANLFPDIPRPLKVTLTDANNSISRMTLIIKGTDIDGVYREERFYRYNGKVQTGKVYFRSIIQVELNEIDGNGPGDTISVGYGVITGVWMQLDNPVESGSESIYSASGKSGTKFDLDDDYEMDYSNGRINIISGGDMVAGTTYYANYDKHEKSIDISAIMPVVTRIVKVLYRLGKTPDQSAAFTIWENMMTIGSPRPGVSQEALLDGEHIAIYYEMRHGPPTETGPGSYPEYLDQVISIGAAGYALMIEALQYELQSVTDLASVRTALTSAKQYLDNNSGEDAAEMMKDITDDAANLRTKMVTAIDAMNSYLDEVDTTDLGAATPDSAEEALKKYENLINQLNDGESVPALGSDYARAWVSIAQVRTQAAIGYAQEFAARLSDLRSHVEQSAGYDRIAEDFIAQAGQYQETVANDMLLADRFRAEAQIRLGEFNRILESKAEYRKRIVSVPVRQPA